MTRGTQAAGRSGRERSAHLQIFPCGASRGARPSSSPVIDWPAPCNDFIGSVREHP
jgi:hypothetical protein